MFRQSLVVDSDSKTCISLLPKWIKPQPWLVRVPFFDPDDSRFVYVNSYSEKTQEYILSKYRTETGCQIWQQHVINGGYGTPAIFKNYVVALDGFDSVVFLCKETGNQVHQIKFGDRIRSSVNVQGGLCWLTHASHIIALNDKFEIVKDKHVTDAFMFGTITFYNDIVIATGTKYVEADNSAHKFVWAFGINSLELHYTVDLGSGRIISSDTSGAWIQGDRLLVSNNDEILCLRADNGSLEWMQRVAGKVHRHVVVSDDNNVFYTTLKGVVGSLDLRDGHLNWSLRMRERIVAPPTIIGGSLIVSSDCSVIVLRKKDGLAYQKLPVGHLPYSAFCASDGKVFVGAGEPPSNGVLACFEVTSGYGVATPVIDSFCSGANLDSGSMSLSVTFAKGYEGAYLDPSVISTQQECVGVKLSDEKYVFKFSLKKSNVEGLYALPISLRCFDGRIEMYMVNVEIERTQPLPPSTSITCFDRAVEESNALTSGAALIQMVNQYYGKEIRQEAFREIIDYLKDRSQWEDADFQTWRLIMKRALTSPAHDLTEFKALEKEGEREMGLEDESSS